MLFRTNVYIDAFNLYYGSLRNSPYRWLDLNKFCRTFLPQNDILTIRYFTALIEPHKKDPDQRNRQLTYLRALKTLPNIVIHYGAFLSHIQRKPLAYGSGYAEVRIVSEKGSDVNLATYLIHDAHRDKFDVAVIVTNDTDLVEPLRIVRYELHKRIGIINPQKHPSLKLIEVANFYKQVRTGVLRNSQFPETLKDGRGTFHKPVVW